MRATCYAARSPVNPFAVEVMETKDGRFFRHCARIFTLHGGVVLGPAQEASRVRKPSPQQRP